MNKKEAQASRALLIGLMAQEKPGEVEHLLKRAEELKQEFIDKILSIKDKEKRAMEVVSFSLFVSDIDAFLEEIEKRD